MQVSLESPLTHAAAGWAATLLLTAIRLGGFFFLAPLFGDRAVSWRFKLGLTLLVAALIAPGQGEPRSDVAELGPAALREAILGIVLGLGVLLVVSAARWAGGWMAQAAGLPEATTDPLPPEGLTRWLDLSATAVFLAAGGHRFVLGGLMDSFAQLPCGADLHPQQLADQIAHMTALSFAVAARAAAPVLLTMLAVQWAAGVAARGAPVWNAWSIGIVLQIGVLFGVLLLAAPLTVWATTDPLPDLLELWRAGWTPSPSGGSPPG